MHDTLSPHRSSSESLPQRLVSEADPQHGNRRVENSKEFDTHAGFTRRARSRGDDHPRGSESLEFFKRPFVVSRDEDIGTQFTEVLDQIESE